MSDPFFIDSPTCISFSGGRTSAYMLRRTMLSNNMRLPDDAIACFANTGKEEEETLKFVRDCGIQWNVPITWIEYRNDDIGYEIVDYETASRNGEPFESIIRKKSYLPNPVTRFCTIELKIRPMARYLLHRGFGRNMAECENMSMIGIRADEPRRAAKIADKGRIPLYTAGVTVETVQAFWAMQSFNLELPTYKGRTLAGNCDLCFLKPAGQILSLVNQRPSRADWWVRMEALALASKPSGGRFRSDRASYAQMRQNAQDQVDFIGHEDEGIPCFCGD